MQAEWGAPKEMVCLCQAAPASHVPGYDVKWRDRCLVHVFPTPVVRWLDSLVSSTLIPHQKKVVQISCHIPVSAPCGGQQWKHATEQASFHEVERLLDVAACVSTQKTKRGAIWFEWRKVIPRCEVTRRPLHHGTPAKIPLCACGPHQEQIILM